MTMQDAHNDTEASAVQENGATRARRNDNTAAARGREYRRRLKEGLKPILIEVREQEVDILVERQILAARERSDKMAIAAAIYVVLDRAFAALDAGSLPQ
jgi:hypothetical protein